METELAYCPTCRHPVRLAWSPAPTHEGHANIPDAPDLVYLEAVEGCTGGACPLTGMALLLARSGTGQALVTGMRCGGCGQEAGMEAIDRGPLCCPRCGTIDRWILLELHNRGWIAIARG